MNLLKNKTCRIIAVIGGAVIIWSILATLYGPDSAHGLSKRLDGLKKDSIALQANFIPRGHYTHFRDIDKEVDNIRDLGKPLRYDSTDSMRVFSNPQTAALANYNMAKCDSILCDVLPLWREAFALALHNDFKEQVVIRFGTDANGRKDNTELFIYSLKYLSEDKVTSDAMRYNAVISNLGFKRVSYSASPNNIEYSYSFE